MTKIIVLFLAFTSSAIFAQTTFQKTYGTTGLEEGRFIEKTADGGYIIAGATTYFDSTAYDSFIIKVNSWGDTLWTKTIGTNNQSEWITSIRSTSDGGIICLISLDSNWPAYGFLVKLDALGNIFWSEKIGPLEQVFDIIETFDGGFAFSYSMFSNFGIVKTNSIGNILWTTLDSVNSFYLPYKGSLVQTADSGFALATSLYNGDVNIYLLKLDSLGNSQWGKLYNTPDDDYLVSIKQTSDLGFIIGGAMLYTPYSKATLIKTNSVGDTIWTKAYFSPPDISEFPLDVDVIQNADGGYSFPFVSNSFAFNNKIIMTKTDLSGNILLTKIFGGLQDDWPDDILQTTDNGFLISGCTKSFGHSNGLCDVYLIKTDSIGYSGCNNSSVSLTTEYLDLTVSNLMPMPATPSAPIIASSYPYYVKKGFSTSTICFSVGIQEDEIQDFKYNLSPNPFSTISTLEILISSEFKNATIEIIDLLGRKLKTVKIVNSKTILTREDLPAGIYIFRLQTDMQIIGSGKFVVE